MSENYNRYVIFLELLPEKALNRDIVKEHVEHLKLLEADGTLVMCGPFQDGKGGMIILKVESYEEAKRIAEKDPFVIKGFEKYTIRILELSCKENNHMGMG